MKDFAQSDKVLKSHLEKPRAKNATYLSPSSQNDMINVIGLDYIHVKIISEIKQAKFFSMIADEVSSHNIEHLWTADDKINAMAHLKAVANFEFIYALVTLQCSLLYLVKLQGVNQDISSDIALIETCSSELRALRGDVSSYSGHVFSHSSRIANNSKVSIAIPRISRHQQHRSNYASQSPEEYFKVSVVIPFLDHLISELSIRFDNHTKQATLLQHLLPSIITETSNPNDIEQAINLYRDDLPNPSIVDEELHQWNAQWLSKPMKDRPDMLNSCLKCCSSESSPNIFMLLKLFATLPMTSCSCEHSASDLRRLNTFLRSTQSEERKINIISHYTQQLYHVY